jgi:hypothetical protein
MPAKVSRGLALIGASLVWCSCTSSGGSGDEGRGGSGGITGSAGTNGGAGTSGSAGSVGTSGAGGGIAGATGQAGGGGGSTGSGGGGTSGGGATGGGIAGTGGGAVGQGGRGGGAAGVAGNGGGPGAGGALGAAGRGGAGGGSAGSVGSGGSSAGGSTGSGGTTGGGGLPGNYDKENTGADCPASPAPPAFSALPMIANLPDPFLMTSGTRISKISDWRCRRAEISSQIQYWGTGPKGAPPPASAVTSTYSGGNLTVKITQSGATIDLTSKITFPGGTGPFPLVIGMTAATGSLPGSLFNGVATMTFDASQLVPSAFSVTRGAGTYFTMYPDKNTGAMIEWAWGVSRLIDGLYATASQNNIDLTRIAVTGCSYAGKMALYAGAFDERIALTMPEESGGGGEASWRFMSTQTGTEDLDNAQGTAWYAQNLIMFHNPDAPKLPYDQHELVAMIAPRAVLAIENTGIDRLASQAGSVSMRAAKEVYKALGIPDRLGYTQAQASSHCSFPASVQSPDVQAFVDKFLLKKTSANTNVARDSYNTNLTKWVTWTTPTLQ